MTLSLTPRRRSLLRLMSLALLLAAIPGLAGCSLLGPRITGVSIAPTPTTLPHAASLQLIGTATLSNGATKDISTPESGTAYTSSDVAVATVSASGLVQVGANAISGQRCTISLRNGKFTAEFPLVIRNTLAETEVAGDDGRVYTSNYALLDAVINKGRNLAADYVPADLTEPAVRFSFSEQAEKRLMRADAAAALAELFKAASAAGHELAAVSGYRSYATQASIFARNVAMYGREQAARFSAQAGQSEHQTGLTMDVSSAAVGFRLTEEFADTAGGKWLAAHAHEFGFVLRYPADAEAITGYQYEPWHLRYIGRDLAAAVAKAGVTLEEYFGDIVFGRPGRPAIVLAEARLSETAPNGGVARGDKQVSAGTEAIVGADSFVFAVTFQPPPSSAWVDANLTVDGAAYERFDNMLPEGMVQLFFDPGTASSRIAVGFASVAHGGPFGTPAIFNLVRRDEPVGTLRTQEAAGGAWRDVVSGEVITARPLRLRIAFSKAMDKATVEGALLSAAPAAMGLNWVDAQTLEFALANPPSALRLYTRDMRDTEGLWVRGGLPVAFTGMSPDLVGVRPPDAVALKLTVMPTNVVGGLVSPDGKTVAVNRLVEQTGGLNPARLDGPLFIDLASGKATLAPRTARIVGWAGNELLCSSGQTWFLFRPDGSLVREIAQPEENLRLCAVSPDGTRIAAYWPHFVEDGTDNLLEPVDLLIIELATGKLKRYANVTQAFLPPMEWILAAAPAWSPEGNRIALVRDLGENTGQLQVLDLATGTIVTLRDLRGRAPFCNNISWSPDGKWIAAGNGVFTADGSGGFFPPGAVDGAVHFWSRDGLWLAHAAEWRGTNLIPVDGSATLELGPAWGLGWTPEGRFLHIDWPDAGERYRDIEWP